MVKIECPLPIWCWFYIFCIDFLWVFEIHSNLLLLFFLSLVLLPFPILSSSILVSPEILLLLLLLLLALRFAEILKPCHNPPPLSLPPPFSPNRTDTHSAAASKTPKPEIAMKHLFIHPISFFLPSSHLPPSLPPIPSPFFFSLFAKSRRRKL